VLLVVGGLLVGALALAVLVARGSGRNCFWRKGSRDIRNILCRWRLYTMRRKCTSRWANCLSRVAPLSGPDHDSVGI
jgi:hypothetical protein